MNLWASFKELIFLALQQIYGFTNDWGMAIVVLTVLVRLALMPLTVKQTKSMHEMQRIQPKIKELQAKYKDDKDKLQEETMKFYQENKVNPFAGCLPMLLQMPILIALYQVLGGTPKAPGLLIKYLAAEGATGTFYWMIPNISSTPSQVYQSLGLVPALPYVILVAVFAISVWLPQALMPGDKQQKMIGLYMAFVMLFFGWSAPAGVLLYWDVSSLWGVAQQQIMMAMIKKNDAEPEVAAKPEKLPKKVAADGTKQKRGKKS